MNMSMRKCVEFTDRPTSQLYALTRVFYFSFKGSPLQYKQARLSVIFLPFVLYLRNIVAYCCEPGNVLFLPVLPTLCTVFHVFLFLWCIWQFMTNDCVGSWSLLFHLFYILRWNKLACNSKNYSKMQEQTSLVVKHERSRLSACPSFFVISIIRDRYQQG